ncbi:transposable element Tcb2 transposase [Trichonephila clavipes]|nr:transposable element Tcb2 transposase [Trichonephila clavipes]
MPLRHHRSKFKQLPEFEKGRIIGMMEAGWSARRIAPQVGRSDLTKRKCWDQWIEKTSFTHLPGSLRDRQNRHQEGRYIIRHPHVEPPVLLAALQAAPSLLAPVSFPNDRLKDSCHRSAYCVHCY